jgi:hypothetical protein
VPFNRGKTIELLSVALIFFGFLALQLHAISRGNYAGQDYQRHSAIIRVSAQYPLLTLMAPITMTGGTPSTAYHYIGGRIYRIFGERHAWKAMAIVNVTLNIFALLLFYFLICRVVRSGLLRVGCMVFITFLPVMVVTSMVIAADAFMPFFFIASVWMLILIIDRLQKGHSAVGLMALEGALLAGAFLIKGNFIPIFAGMMIVGIILHRYRILRGRRLLFAFLLIIAVPMAVITIFWFGYMSEQTPMYFHRDVPQSLSARINFRSLLFFKGKDAYLLDAPFFHEVRSQDGRVFRPMHENNYYSYPALLHVGIFTDLLNIDQPIRYRSNDPGVVDEYYTRVRPQENQNRMKLSVRTSLVFFLSTFFAVLWLICAGISAVWQRKDPQEIPVIILFVLGLSLFLGMAFALPFMTWTYEWGFWLPRFIVPSILSFGTILFVVLDRMPFTKPKTVRWAILAMVMGQSLLQISFLWV